MNSRNLSRAGSLLALLGVLLLCIGIAGCGGDSNKSASPTPPASSAIASVAATAAPSSATTPVAVPSSAASASPVTFSVLAGKSQGPMDIEMFMPAEIRIREGDSIEWTAQGFEGHSITFGTAQQIKDVFAEYLQPDPQNAFQKIFNVKASLQSPTGETFAGDEAFTNSGFIGVPAESKYKLTFAKRGTYEYLCLVHPFTMLGTVSVDAPDAKVDAPATVAARGQADVARFVAVEQREIDDANAVQRSFVGAGGASIHRVAVGLTTPYGQIATYVKPVLDAKAGDTVIFASDDRDFHNVVFKGAKELPPGVGIRPDPAGRGGFILALSNESAIGVEPPPGFDDKTFMSSGSMGVTQSRLTWTLRFDKPGTYIYNCTIHVLAGMAGVVNVR